jgi:KUP system potassium uptake protein
MEKNSSSSHLLLVVTAIGIVYGDIGTSPLYAFRECFHGIHAMPLTRENVLGVLSLIVWSLVTLVSLKYLLFVMSADNKGEGGTLALMALLMGTDDAKSTPMKMTILVALGLFGASLLVGDGMITPAITVMSAIEGLKLVTPLFDNWVWLTTILILVVLFSIQKYGTQKIGSLFGPITILWFLVLGVLGLVQIVQDPSVLTALNPAHAVEFLMANPTSTFFVFGTVFLVVTGCEALYADMGHFGRKAIAQGWYFCAFPGLLLNYLGQGSIVLSKPETISNPFYHLAPEWFLVPLVLIATLAAVVASQAMISGVYSLANQCIQLGYCPRLRVEHTSDEHRGQIYVPFVNWILLIGSVWLVIEFQSSSEIASAYGIAISLIMVITTVLAGIVAHRIWRWSVLQVIAVAGVFLVVDLIFLSSNIVKINDGGWVPLAIASGLFFLMTTWKTGRTILVKRMRAMSYPFKQLIFDLRFRPPARVSGTAIFMVGDTELTPPALMHNLRHNKVLHETVVFMTVVGREVPEVPQSERVQVSELAPSFYRIIANYGFRDTPDIPALLKKCSEKTLGFQFKDPTYFLGREVLMASHKGTEDMGYWRKKVFTFMAKNATVAAHFFRLPQEQVIEVGMEVEF